MIGIIIVAVVILLVMALGGKNTQIQQIQPTPTPQAANQEAQVKVEDVEVTAAGYVPQNITVKAGTKVVWTNKSGSVVTVDSAQHPTHLVYPPLNLGQFEDGATVSLVFDKPGKYFYHNHLKATQFGSVTVE